MTNCQTKMAAAFPLCRRRQPARDQHRCMANLQADVRTYTRTATKHDYQRKALSIKHDKFPARKLQHTHVGACACHSGNVASSSECKPKLEKKVQTVHALRTEQRKRPTLHAALRPPFGTHYRWINAFFQALSPQVFIDLAIFRCLEGIRGGEGISPHNSFNFQNVPARSSAGAVHTKKRKRPQKALQSLFAEFSKMKRKRFGRSFLHCPGWRSRMPETIFDEESRKRFWWALLCSVSEVTRLGSEQHRTSGLRCIYSRE